MGRPIERLGRVIAKPMAGDPDHRYAPIRLSVGAGQVIHDLDGSIVE